MRARSGRFAVLTLAVGCALVSLGNSPKTPTAPHAVDLVSKNEVDAKAGVVALRAPLDSMVLIPSGSFEMGSNAKEIEFALALTRKEVLGGFVREDQFDAEASFIDVDTDAGVRGSRAESHRVTLAAFFIDRTEVTVSAYFRCVDRGDCASPSFATNDARFAGGELPVSHVSWSDANRYCEFRKARLPTEAEWERAARGLGGRRFPWGMVANPKLANHGALDAGSTIVTSGPLTKMGKIYVGVADDSDGFAGLSTVGNFPAGVTPNGLFDMAGNVAEWVSDVWEDSYAGGPVTAPSGPAIGGARVIRGGSYKQPMALLRAASRAPRFPGTREPDIGFRCARTADP
ncbi:MAG: hypothetical protein NVS3B20_04440 [Polyangiales bacterium]